MKKPHAVALGRLGGKKGGPARAKALTKEQRSAQARKAAMARWGKRKMDEFMSLLEATTMLKAHS